jgi:hypothetical protein
VRVGVRVAVDVEQLHEATQAIRAADPDDPPVVDGDRGGALAGEDVDAASLAVGFDHDGGVGSLADSLAAVAALELAGVRGLRVHREAALREAGERADQIARKAADDARAQEHGVDVPVGVVVGEDRLAQIGLGAGGAQVARGGEDRVDRVVGILLAVLVGVDAVGLPGRRHELHPPERAGEEMFRLRP